MKPIARLLLLLVLTAALCHGAVTDVYIQQRDTPTTFVSRIVNGASFPGGTLVFDGSGTLIGSPSSPGYVGQTNVFYEDQYLTASKQWWARYAVGVNTHAASLDWGSLQLGNNGPNFIIGGRSVTGGSLGFVVNNTADVRMSGAGSAPHNGIEAMTILNNGRVGIGTTSPGQMLAVQSTEINQQAWKYDASNYTTVSVGSTGATQFNAFGSGQRFNFTDDVVVTGSLGVGVPGTIPRQFTIDNPAEAAMGFYTSGTERAVVRTGVANPNLVFEVGGWPALNLKGGQVAEVPGNLGIGTPTPSSKLDVQTSSGGYAVKVWHGAAAGSSYGLVIDAGGNSSDAALYLRDSTATKSFLKVLGDGKVGIGTATPSHTLTVQGTEIQQQSWKYDANNYTTMSVGSTGVTAFDANGANQMFIFNDDLSSNSRIGCPIFMATDTGSSTSMRFPGSHVTEFWNNNAVSMAIDAARKIGINTQYPAARLHIQQSANGQAEGMVLVNNPATQGGYFWLDASANIHIDAASTGNNSIILNGTGASAAGNVGIGTTTPDAKLSVVSSEVGGTISRINIAPLGGQNRVATLNEYSLIFTRPTGGVPAELYANAIDGNFSIGTASAYGKLRVEATNMPQQVWSYNSSNYATLNVGSTGSTTLDAVGSGAAINFNDRVNLANGMTTMGEAYFGLDNSNMNAISINGAVGSDRVILGLTGGIRRWEMSLGNALGETGGNNGSAFVLSARADNGGAIDSPIYIPRPANAPITFNRSLSTNSGTQAGIGTGSIITQGGIYALQNAIIDSDVAAADSQTGGFVLNGTSAATSVGMGGGKIFTGGDVTVGGALYAKNILRLDTTGNMSISNYQGNPQKSMILLRADSSAFISHDGTATVFNVGAAPRFSVQPGSANFNDNLTVAGNLTVTGTISGASVGATVAVTGITPVNTSKLLGRYTGGSGTAEEIAIDGTQFSLSGGTLGITNLNAGLISSGTLNSARMPASITASATTPAGIGTGSLVSNGGIYVAQNAIVDSDVAAADSQTGAFVVNGSSAATSVAMGGGKLFVGGNASVGGNLNVTGTITGVVAGTTDASTITTGILPPARLSFTKAELDIAISNDNAAFLNQANTFSGNLATGSVTQAGIGTGSIVTLGGIYAANNMIVDSDVASADSQTGAFVVNGTSGATSVAMGGGKLYAGQQIHVGNTISLVSGGTSTFASGQFAIDSTGGIAVNGNRFIVDEDGHTSIGVSGTPVIGVFSASSAIDFVSMVASSEDTKTVNVTNASVAGIPTVSLGWNAALPDGIVVKQAWVSANGVVSIRVRNTSASTIDPGGLSVRATVTQF